MEGVLKVSVSFTPQERLQDSALPVKWQSANFKRKNKMKLVKEQRFIAVITQVITGTILSHGYYTTTDLTVNS